jgi:hypothetical protein
MVGLCRRTATGEDEQIADVIDQALLLARKKFEQFEISLVRKRQVRYVVKLATDGLLQQAGEERETCGICLEVSSRIHAVEGCGHGFCLPCMRKHVRVKLLHGLLPGCPSHGCRSMLSVEGSKAFLPAPALETMAQRIREAQIPPGDKLYCPYPKCSALMSLSQLVQATNTTKAAARKQCVSCGGWLCVRCKVPWHQGMGCHEYKQLRLLLPGKEEDAMLEKLAKRRLWRQCGRCKHMIELAGGCYHVRCRCGYAFCYGCGLQLQASCSCQQGQQGWRRRLFSCVPCPWWW